MNQSKDDSFSTSASAPSRPGELFKGNERPPPSPFGPEGWAISERTRHLLIEAKTDEYAMREQRRATGLAKLAGAKIESIEYGERLKYRHLPLEERMQLLELNPHLAPLFFESPVNEITDGYFHPAELANKLASNGRMSPFDAAMINAIHSPPCPPPGFPGGPPGSPRLSPARSPRSPGSPIRAASPVNNSTASLFGPSEGNNNSQLSGMMNGSNMGSMGTSLGMGQSTQRWPQQAQPPAGAQAAASPGQPQAPMGIQSPQSFASMSYPSFGSTPSATGAGTPSYSRPPPPGPGQWASPGQNTTATSGMPSPSPPYHFRPLAQGPGGAGGAGGLGGLNGSQSGLPPPPSGGSPLSYLGSAAPGMGTPSGYRYGPPSSQPITAALS